MSEQASKKGERYTSEELMVRLKLFIGICLALTLTGIVFVVLYSIIFVTQPLGAISPVDTKFFELIVPLATFLTGTLSGIMLAGTGKEAAMAGMNANGLPRPPIPGSPLAPRPMAPSFGPNPNAPYNGSGFATPAINPGFTPPVSTPPVVRPPINPTGAPLVARPQFDE